MKYEVNFNDVRGASIAFFDKVRRIHIFVGRYYAWCQTLT